MTTYTPESGESIYIAAQKATRIANSMGEDIEFNFNNIELITTPSSNPDDIAVIYALKCEIQRYGNNDAIRLSR